MSICRVLQGAAGVVVITTSAVLGQPASVAATAGSAWNQSGGNAAHTALITDPGGLDPDTVGSLVLSHSTVLSDDPQTTPAVVGGTAYVATHSGLVIAVSTSTGHQIWQHARCSSGEPASNAFEDSTPAVGDGRIFVTESGGSVMTSVRLAAPHQRTCVHLQPANSPSATSWSPTLAGHTVYEITATRVEAIDAGTGHVTWSRTLPATADPAADVVVRHGTVYAAFNTFGNGIEAGHVIALQPGDGSLEWKAARSSYIATLAASRGRLVAGGGVTSAWDAATGTPLWSSSCRGTDAVSLIGRSVIVTGGEAGSCQGSVQRLAARNGHVVWSTSIASELEAQASVGGGVVYVMNLDTSNVDILRLGDGVVLRSLHRGSVPYDAVSTPVVVGGTLWAISGNGRLDGWSVP